MTTADQWEPCMCGAEDCPRCFPWRVVRPEPCDEEGDADDATD